jgi:hypothetical protein
MDLEGGGRGTASAYMQEVIASIGLWLTWMTL